MDACLRYDSDAPPEYAEFALCREMGWTFEELDRQPAERIEQAFLFLQREGVWRKLQQS